MKYRKRLIEVRTLPVKIDGARLRTLYHELESCINVDAPLWCLDCSLLLPGRQTRNSLPPVLP